MNIVLSFVAILFLAAVAEAVVERLGIHVPSHIKPYFAMLISIAICVLYSADVLALAGLTSQIPIAAVC